MWRPQPFKWRGENYVLRIGNCHGLHFVQETDVIDALKLCNIKSKDLMLLLPSHIRDLICTQNGNNNNNNNNYNNNDNIDNKKETNSNEVDGQDYQLVKSKALCDCEEFVRRGANFTGRIRERIERSSYKWILYTTIKMESK